ncbi:MAG: hypothetical protein ACYS5V_09985 [Planctomycetota bacterium]
MSAKRKKSGWALACLALLLPTVGAACDGDRAADALPLSTPVAQSPWRFATVPGRRLVTEHYHIYTTTDNRIMLRHLPGFMESAYGNFGDLTGLSAPASTKHMTFYLMGNRAQWAAMTRRVTGPRSRLYLSMENGGYCERGVCVLWDMRSFSTFVLAAHEGMHQFLYHRLKQKLPAWAEEGLAVQAEGFAMGTSTVRFDPQLNSVRLVRLRDLITQGRWMPLEKLLATDAGDHIAGGASKGLDYYGQLWALLMYIRGDERYRAGFERLLGDAAAGRFRSAMNVPDAMGSGRRYTRTVAIPAFRHYIDPDLAAFEKGFKAYARKLAKLP